MLFGCVELQTLLGSEAGRADRTNERLMLQMHRNHVAFQSMDRARVLEDFATRGTRHLQGKE